MARTNVKSRHSFLNRKQQYVMSGTSHKIQEYPIWHQCIIVQPKRIYSNSEVYYLKSDWQRSVSWEGRLLKVLDDLSQDNRDEPKVYIALWRCKKRITIRNQKLILTGRFNDSSPIFCKSPQSKSIRLCTCKVQYDKVLIGGPDPCFHKSAAHS